MSTFEVGKPAPYYCKACQALPQEGYCKMAGCPTAPSASTLAQAAVALHQAGYHDLGEAVDSMAAQRDELLNALRAITGSEGGFYRVAMPAALREAAREAIAKAEGK